MPNLFRTLTLLAAITLPLAAPAQTVDILFNSFIPPQHPANTRVLKPWAEDIVKATEGRVKIEIPSTSLAAPPQQLDGVTKGIFDMGYQFHGFLLDRIKLTQIAHLPFVNTTAKGSSIALWRTYEKYFAKANEFKDVHLLGLWSSTGAAIFSMKSPIDSVRDLSSIKIFSTPGVPAKIMTSSGAGVVAAPSVRSYEIISGGTVDAFTGYSLMDAVSFNTLQYAKSVTYLPGQFTVSAFALFINKKKWASISPKDREIITRMSGETLAARFAAFDELEAKERAEAVAKGVVFLEASPAFVAELTKFAAPIEKDWLADAAKLGVDGPAALAYYKEQALKNAR